MTAKKGLPTIVRRFSECTVVAANQSQNVVVEGWFVGMHCGGRFFGESKERWQQKRDSPQ